MRKLYLILLLIVPIVSSAQSGNARYTLFATINNSAKTVTGFEKVVYKNTTAQPLSFIWFRLCPNAYANDRTAYSEYLLKNDDLRFYFSKPEQRGYINQLDFQSGDKELKTEFDSTKNDLIKVYLSNPLQPGDSAEITTPFFVKIPFNFDRGMEYGYNGDDTIYLSHWYPEVAYQDENGWDLKPFVSYSTLKSDSANFYVKINTSAKSYYGALNATLIKKDIENDKTTLEYKLNKWPDFMFAIPSDAYNIVELETPQVPQGYEKLIPRFLKNKRPDDDSATQQLINQKINGIDSSFQKSLKPAFLFNLKETDKYRYLSFLPSVGYNNYDKIMIGAMIHNYQLPLNKFNFLLAPMYATNSKMFAGVGRLEYNIWQPKKWWQFSISGEKFSINDFQLDNGTALFQHVNKFVPSISYTKYAGENHPDKKWNFLLRSFFLSEDFLASNFYDSLGVQHAADATGHSTIVQLQSTLEDGRALYPYSANLTIDATKDFLRAGFTGNYFFNYDAGGQGLNARFFAGKFIYLKTQTPTEEFETDRYHLNLSGASGAQDYTYSDYFVGRNEYNGWMSQQIMQRDGFFKVSTPLLNDVVGKSDDWLTALNLTADIPDKINPLSVLPFKIPLKAFLDIGTFSDAWKDNPQTGRFLYDAGLQVSLLKGAVNVYFPLIYSKVYRDYYASNKQIYPHRFVNMIRFSINVEKLKPKVLHKILPL